MRFIGLFIVATLWVLGCGSGPVGPMPGRDGGVGSPDRGMPGVCEVPLEQCDGACVDVQSNGRHCGACGNACAAGTFCQGGTCASDCGNGLDACGASCVDLATDPDNCGTCDMACAPGSLCVSGACACPTGFIECGGSCIDAQTDPANCGLCDRTCEADQRCNAGTCVCSGAEREMACTDGADDDCDGLVDCADSDCAEMTRPCEGMCGAGVETCQSDGTWGTCSGGDGSAEICGDGIDQDCDGSDLRMLDMFEPNDSCDACVFASPTADPDHTLMASFDSVSDRVDCFAFDVVDNVSVFTLETVEVDLTNIPVGHDYDVYVYSNRADCTANRPIASGVRSGNAPEHIVWTERDGISDSGTFYVRVIPFRGASCTANYSLRFNGLN